jgi:hypothetical protein
MSSTSSSRLFSTFGFVHTFVYCIVVSLALSLYALSIALITQDEVVVYLLVTLLSVSCGFFGQVVLHKLTILLLRVGGHNMVVTLPVSFLVQALLLAALIAWRNTETLHRFLQYKPTLLLIALVVVVFSNLVSVYFFKRIGLNLATNRSLKVVSTVLLVSIVAATGAMTLRGKMPADGDSIVLITVDSWRYDHVNDISPELITPNVSKLQQGAVTFDNCQTHAPYTWTSLASIMTSLEGPFHGVRVNGQTLADDQLTLAEILSNHGYRCFVAADIGVDVIRRGPGIQDILTPEGIRDLRVLQFQPDHGLRVSLLFRATLLRAKQQLAHDDAGAGVPATEPVG